MRQPSPTWRRSSSIASLSSKTLGSSSASSLESSASGLPSLSTSSCAPPPPPSPFAGASPPAALAAGAFPCPSPASNRRAPAARAAGAGLGSDASSGAPLRSRRVLLMLFSRSGAWLPERSSVSIVMTAGKQSMQDAL
eukprot:6188502-Pleurochrysis_carterae.AAC.2